MGVNGGAGTSTSLLQTASFHASDFVSAVCHVAWTLTCVSDEQPADVFLFSLNTGMQVGGMGMLVLQKLGNPFPKQIVSPQLL